ncbi:ATP-binding cassette domain-containing protein [Devosia algicola]|uniref:ATP-binding cassette domain-containing protein n=1 Tax=Devosia algicola TaxID=3026418 RepID=A0ABY7YS31_9HYPH|nr:ATP-binding cassette domain-containing protein [Devosia algicola]WDR03928.1 ATP-binding cassette domain-containing protein [Devosia algicola]
MPLTPMHTDSPEPLLRIRGLKTHFFTADGVVKAVDGVDLDVQQSRTTCILGESGCGKSIMARSILRIVDAPGRIVEGSITYRAADGRTVDLAAMSPTSRAYPGNSRQRYFDDISRTYVVVGADPEDRQANQRNHSAAPQDE